MFPRRFVVRAALSSLAALSPLAVAGPARGQDLVPPEVETARLQLTGRINANAVYVHSGAGQNYYPTMKLDKDDQVTVVGEKFDWLKIVPPEGSFSYVGKVFVERSGDGSTGRVTRPDVRVRAGSDLNEFKGIVQAQLEQGQTVQIIGERDEYFMIKPPPGAYVYVNKQFVDPTGDVAAAGQQPDAGQQAEQPGQADTVAQQPAQSEQTPVMQTPTAAPDPAAAAVQQPVAVSPEMLQQQIAIDTSAPQQPADPTASAAAPTTQPQQQLTADVRFDQAEDQFELANRVEIDQQPLDELQGLYTDLLTDAALPESMRRIAEFRLQTIKMRLDARGELTALRQQQDESAQRQMALRAEQEELAQVIEQSQVQVYSAVGTLQTSSLQQGKQMLYRLTDPATGRTLVYVRSDDASLPGFIGQFIGVRGEVTTEPRLSMRVVVPTGFELVDRNELYRGVAADIVPPSLQPSVQASTPAPTE